jgi:hypothetical protein
METILGLIGLVVYIAAVVALSAAVTLAVVKISPAKSPAQRTKA